MNIYLLEQKINIGYDTYDSCVVISENSDAACCLHPDPYVTHFKNDEWMGMTKFNVEYEFGLGGWVHFSQRGEIKVTLLGVSETDVSRVVCSSFNAG